MTLTLRPSRFARFAAAPSLLGALLAASACSKTAQVPLTIEDPDGLRANAAWAELDILPDSCPDDLTRLADGDPTLVVVQQQIVPADQEFEAPTALNASTYGVAVLLKDEACGTIAIACANANLQKVPGIRLRLEAYTPTTSCPGSCNAGTCGTPGTGGSGGAGGAGGSAGKSGSAGSGGGTPGSCTLDLLKSAGLAPAIEIGATVTGPGVVATQTGFLVGYRDLSADASKDRVVVVPVGTEGTSTAPNTTNLTPCKGAIPDSGFGFAMNGDVGLIATPRAPCAADGAENGAGISFVQTNAGGQVIGAQLLKGMPGFAAIAMSRGAVAKVPTSASQFKATYVQDQKVRTFIVEGVSAKSNFEDVFAPLAGSKFAASGSSPALLAQLGDVSDSMMQPKLALRLEPAGMMAKTSFLDPVPAALAAVVNDKTVLVTRSGTGDLAFSILKPDGTVSSKGTFPMGPYKGFDVAPFGNKVVVVAGQNLGYRVFVISDVEGSTASPDKNVGATAQTIADLKSFDGNQISIAAANGRIAVGWVSRNVLGQSDPTGGFAVYKCE